MAKQSATADSAYEFLVTEGAEKAVKGGELGFSVYLASFIHASSSTVST